MLIEEYKNDIRIEYSKVPPGQPDGPPMAPYFTYLSAIDVPGSWMPEVLCIEKMTRMWMIDDPAPEGDEVLWEYVIHLDKSYNEYIKLIFRHKNVALSTLKHFKAGTEIDYRKEFPELFL